MTIASVLYKKSGKGWAAGQRMILFSVLKRQQRVPWFSY